jgi:DNA-binding XRE family transcriptional regulator
MDEINYEYTDQDIISWFKVNCGVKKTRKREYLDQRNYVIAVLYQKFGYSEQALASLFGVERTSINHSKRHAYNLLVEYSDDKFIRNTYKLISKFPFDFSVAVVNETLENPLRRIDVRNIEPEYYRKIIRLAARHNMTKEKYLKHIIYKTLDFIVE